MLERLGLGAVLDLELDAGDAHARSADCRLVLSRETRLRNRETIVYGPKVELGKAPSGDNTDGPTRPCRPANDPHGPTTGLSRAAVTGISWACLAQDGRSFGGRGNREAWPRRG